MNILALDMSTPRADLALQCHGKTLLQKQWVEPRKGEALLFDTLNALLRESGLTWEGVDCFCAGRGPGNYSGLRIAITVMQALALPARQPVFFLNSGVAVAETVFEQRPCDRVAVVGDARRGMLWYALFDRPKAGETGKSPDWQLVPWADFDAQVPVEIPRVSSAWSSIRSSESFALLDVGAWVDADVYPQASMLAAQVETMLSLGLESEPATPIYMHPPVAS